MPTLVPAPSIHGPSQRPLQSPLAKGSESAQLKTVDRRIDDLAAPYEYVPRQRLAPEKKCEFGRQPSAQSAGG
jgi:hypothetical protein